MRYQFYREHKYVSAALNDLERLIAKTDFRNPEELNAVAAEFQNLSEMLKGHAEHENNNIHALLKKKHSSLHEHAEEDHDQQDSQLLEIQQLIDSLSNTTSDNEKVSLGYKLYLTYRKFVGDNLLHLHEEETVILPELQRLYTDAELKQVEAETYRIMTPEDMVHMMQVLFPQMNSSDRIAFLSDIREAQPEKFPLAWKGIASTLSPQEQKTIATALRI
jgi:hypothetical protein